MKIRKDKKIQDILEDLRCDQKHKVMLYINKDVQEELKNFCKEKKIRMSNLVEKLLKKFLTEIKN